MLQFEARKCALFIDDSEAMDWCNFCELAQWVWLYDTIKLKM